MKDLIFYLLSETANIEMFQSCLHEISHYTNEAVYEVSFKNVTILLLIISNNT